MDDFICILQPVGVGTHQQRLTVACVFGLASERLGAAGTGPVSAGADRSDDIARLGRVPAAAGPDTRLGPGALRLQTPRHRPHGDAQHTGVATGGNGTGDNGTRDNGTRDNGTRSRCHKLDYPAPPGSQRDVQHPYRAHDSVNAELRIRCYVCGP